MEYFSTSLSNICYFVENNPHFESVEVLKEMVGLDLGRTQINDKIMYAPSGDDFKTSSEIIATKTSYRLNFEKFFLNYFVTHKENLPYNQGMISGSLVDAVLFKEFGSDQEKTIELRQNTQNISFCYQTDAGDWKGVFVKVDLENKEWYAVVTDFSQQQGPYHDVAIVGSGQYFDILKTHLRLDEGQIPMNDLIENKKFQLYLKYLDIHLKRLKILDTRKSNERFSKYEIYRQCFHPLVTMGVSEEIMNRKEEEIRQKELSESFDGLKEKKQKRKFWNMFKTN